MLQQNNVHLAGDALADHVLGVRGHALLSKVEVHLCLAGLILYARFVHRVEYDAASICAIWLGEYQTRMP